MKFFNNIENQKYQPLNLFEKLRSKFGKNFLIIILSMVAFSSLPQEGNSQNNNNINKKEIKINNSNEKIFKENREWMINWYKNRVINDKELQFNFELIKSNIINNYEKVVFIEDVEPLYSKEGIRGIAMNRNDTVFLDLNKINNKNRNTAIGHELGHQAMPYNEMPGWVIYLIKNALDKSEDNLSYQSSLNKKEMGQLISYLKEPGEIYTRICILRREYNFKPNQIITQEDLEKVYLENNSDTPNGPKNWNINELLALIKKKLLLDLLNKLP